jgi:hypothetical protein
MWTEQMSLLENNVATMASDHIATMTLDTTVALDTIVVCYSLVCPADIIVHDVSQKKPLEFWCTLTSTPFQSWLLINRRNSGCVMKITTKILICLQLILKHTFNTTYLCFFHNTVSSTQKLAGQYYKEDYRIHLNCHFFILNTSKLFYINKLLM